VKDILASGRKVVRGEERVNRATVLAKMRTFFEENDAPPEVLANLADAKATSIIRESIEALEFLMYLETELGAKINVNSLGPALANMTLGELATEICRQIDQ
jgi:hypothetical protein